MEAKERYFTVNLPTEKHTLFNMCQVQKKSDGMSSVLQEHFHRHIGYMKIWRGKLCNRLLRHMEQISTSEHDRVTETRSNFLL